MKSLTVSNNFTTSEKIDSFFKKLVQKPIFWVLFCSFVFFFPIVKSLNRKLPDVPEALFKVPHYSLWDENGKVFDSQSLKGKVYVANFIFTSCPSSCLKLTQTMSLIQKRVRGLGQKVQLISFSVDPGTDTSPVLFKYARKNKANPYVWKFLTGKEEDILKLLKEGFKVPVGTEKIPQNFKVFNEQTQKAENVTLMDIAHSERFALVDQRGQLRKYYSSSKEDINKMMIDIGLLVNKDNSIL